MKYELITILGPTAVGKTRLAAKLAHRFNGQIISADSRQVYRGMDIGTGKDIADYTVNQKTIPYHLIDILPPNEEFNLFSFKKEFDTAFEKIKKKNKTPFLVGGTGLYLSAILKGYNLVDADFNSERFNQLMNLSQETLAETLLKINPEQHNTTDLKIKERIVKAIIIAEAEKDKSKIKKSEAINSLVIGVSRSRDEIKKSITSRLKTRLDEGMIDEVKNLIESGVPKEKLEFFGLEYKFISRYIYNEINYNDMFQKLNSAIHSFAKRQMTWFRKMEREGIRIHWINGPDEKAAAEIIDLEYFNKHA
ncbi:MAG: tRNA (adenosine(37)-N6)-dimethylallyltransferase MiaA [Ignavibacteriae bacterium]|nr:tRNA (adenosine(37)-N6)-dimethylallyltransferase MiaA [Ignavibacteriota bacterium]NOG98999.1 tRNA (adenosine(37)-N6)-dimethylallyltransferase MiaA [Ignavibacteriota bacterium]